MAYNQRTAGIIYGCFKQYGIKTVPHKVLEAVHGAAWREGTAVGKMGGLLKGAREWNSALSQGMFESDSWVKRRRIGFIRRSRANGTPRWEAPLVQAWGSTCRLEERETEDQWKRGSICREWRETGA